MAWTSEPEVAVARDAARKLGDSPLCVVLWVTDDEQIGMASYGRSRALCGCAKELGEHVLSAAENWGER